MHVHFTQIFKNLNFSFARNKYILVPSVNSAMSPVVVEFTISISVISLYIVDKKE